MQLHTDYSQRVVIRPGDVAWAPSPEPGVERLRLERDGDEVARATSIVRYAAGSKFAAHEHGGGEEFLVLEGVFEDEAGAYPAGTYVRNPVGSRHAPFSRAGTTILVKLRQFAPEDQAAPRIDIKRAQFHPGPVPGLSMLPLHRHGREQVAIIDWAPGARLDEHGHDGGEEVYVLSGILSDEFGDYPAGTWIRSPSGSRHAPYSTHGCRIWIKTGHLPPA
jgi:anti-sigma factor ChrR (cupin superfamily)